MTAHDVPLAAPRPEVSMGDFSCPTPLGTKEMLGHLLDMWHAYDKMREVRNSVIGMRVGLVYGLREITTPEIEFLKGVEQQVVNQLETLKTIDTAAWEKDPRHVVFHPTRHLEYFLEGIEEDIRFIRGQAARMRSAMQNRL